MLGFSKEQIVEFILLDWTVRCNCNNSLVAAALGL